MRVQIRPGLVRLWRGPRTLQIGLDPRRGTVLEGVGDSERAVLEALAEGLDPRRLPGGPAGDGSRHLVELLAEAGVLLTDRAGRGVLSRLGPDAARLVQDAAAWSLVRPQAGDGWELLAARGTRRVEVRGRGRTAFALAGTLVAAGVGTVTLGAGGGPVRTDEVGPLGPWPQDVGSPLEAAAERTCGLLGRTPPRWSPATPDLVVLVDPDAADAARAEPLVRDDVPHLSVVPQEAGIVVGPLVVPGRGPCLRCLDLHRADRDPHWPRMLAQLLQPPGARRDEPAEAGRGRGSTARPAAATQVRHGTQETASSVLAAGLAALQVLGHLDGGTPAALGATLEIELPDGLPSRRPWPAHPACGCSWPPRSPPDRSPGDARSSPPGSGDPSEP